LGWRIWTSIFLKLFCNLFLLLLYWEHIYKISYNISQLNLPPPSFSFIPLPPIPGIVSTGLISYLHTCVHSICTTPTLSALSHILHFTLSGTNPQDRTCFAFLFCFCKKMTFVFSFLKFLLFICAYNVCVIFIPFPLLPPSPSPPPRFWAETVLPLSLILLKRDYKH
jgi:hypothetical protein